MPIQDQQQLDQALGKATFTTKNPMWRAGGGQ